MPNPTAPAICQHCAKPITYWRGGVWISGEGPVCSDPDGHDPEEPPAHTTEYSRSATKHSR